MFQRPTNRNRIQRKSPPRGISLLEVILSIAILGVSMAAIGQLYNVGYRSALRSRLQSEANILADSTMAELAAGVLPLESIGDAPIANNPDWVYSIDLVPSEQPGLFVATVNVGLAQRQANNSVSVSVVRFVPDPDYEPEESEEE